MAKTDEKREKMLLLCINQPNNSNAADGWDLLMLNSRFLAAADLRRYAAKIPGGASDLVANQLAFRIDRSSELP